MLYVSSDHGGYQLKEEILKYLKSRGTSVIDLGPTSLNESDDYPEYTLKLVQKLREDLSSNNGILICRNGVGVSMLGNKFRGVRVALSWDPKHAVSSRKDDDTNVLALPAGYISTETAIKIVEAWLSENFSNADRHVKRLELVKEFGQ